MTLKNKNRYTSLIYFGFSLNVSPGQFLTTVWPEGHNRSGKESKPGHWTILQSKKKKEAKTFGLFIVFCVRELEVKKESHLDLVLSGGPDSFVPNQKS